MIFSFFANLGVRLLWSKSTGSSSSTGICNWWNIKLVAKSTIIAWHEIQWSQFNHRFWTSKFSSFYFPEIEMLKEKQHIDFISNVWIFFFHHLFKIVSNAERLRHIRFPFWIIVLCLNFYSTAAAKWSFALFFCVPFGKENAITEAATIVNVFLVFLYI